MMNVTTQMENITHMSEDQPVNSELIEISCFFCTPGIGQNVNFFTSARGLSLFFARIHLVGGGNWNSLSPDHTCHCYWSAHHAASDEEKVRKIPPGRSRDLHQLSPITNQDSKGRNFV